MIKSNCIICGNEIPYEKIAYAMQCNNFAKYCSNKCKEKNRYDEIPNNNCKLGYIYCLMLDNKPIYIGQTLNIRKRFKEHKCNIKDNNKLIYRYIRWYSEIKPNYTFDIKVLKCCSDKELNSYEKRYIYFCIKKGYNIKNNCIYTKIIKSAK
jgi:hypothetical protein